MTVVEGIALVCQARPVSRITDEGRVGLFEKLGGLGLNIRKRGGRRRETGGVTQSVRGKYNSFKGASLTVVEGIHYFIMCIL